MELEERLRRSLQSSLRDWKGMEEPRMARTSSSFLALPVTKVTAFGSTRAAAVPDMVRCCVVLCFRRQMGECGGYEGRGQWRLWTQLQ